MLLLQASCSSLTADVKMLRLMPLACMLQGLELVSICRGLPGDVLSRQPVRQAVTAYSALTRGDVGVFLKLYSKAMWRQKRLMQVKLLQAGSFSLVERQHNPDCMLLSFTILAHGTGERKARCVMQHTYVTYRTQCSVHLCFLFRSIVLCRVFISTQYHVTD